MDGRDHLFQAEADAPERGIEAEAAGEGLIHREAVGRQVPEPGADDGPGRERELDALDVLPRQRLAGAQGGLCLPARGHVAEQHRHLPPARRLNPGGRDLDMARRRTEIAFEADRTAGAEHVAVELDPAIRLIGREAADRLADDVRDAGMPLIAGIGLDMDVVAQRSVRPVEELDDAEAVVHRVEQGAVTGLPFAQGLLGLLAVGDVEHGSDQPHRPAILEMRLALGRDPALDPILQPDGAILGGETA